LHQGSGRGSAGASAGTTLTRSEHIMNTRQLITPVTRTLSAFPSMGALPQLGASALLGWVGLTQRRSRVGTRSALVAVGALIGAGTALLLAPSSGSDLRTRLGKSTGGALGSSVGKLLGQQMGGHPVRTAKVVDTAQEVLGSKQS
jgi:hypothetical protein